jgi:hypothetical protein
VIHEVKKMEGVESVVLSKEVCTFIQINHASKMFVMHNGLDKLHMISSVLQFAMLMLFAEK